MRVSSLLYMRFQIKEGMNIFSNTEQLAHGLVLLQFPYVLYSSLPAFRKK